MADSGFLKYANSFQAIARLRLESIECLLEHLGNPERDLKFIHVAGTNGKGSVCAFLQCILTDSGLRTGKYISPNLISVCERISIDGEEISEADIERIMAVVQKSAEAVREKYGEPPTQFELWTAAAFCYFKEKKCDVVVLETGLGGTRDATNIIPPPVASVITHIALDHTGYLGNTLAEIAEQKAGIIKEPNIKNIGLTVSAIQESSAAAVIEKACRERKNRLAVAQKPNIKGTQNCREVFDYGDMNGIVCGISGLYQPGNAAVAIETAKALGIDEKFIRSGIERAKNPARFEIIRDNPTVIYDGAHNLDGMTALAQSILRYFPSWDGATFITAFMADKDIRGEFEELKKSGLLDGSEVCTVTVRDNPRAASAAEVCSVARNCGANAKDFDSIRAAYDYAVSKKRLTVICGSLYLYKDLAEETDALEK